MAYWWQFDPTERFWVEIRHLPGIGTELRCPLADESGRPNAWYDLVATTQPKDVVYHWNAVEHRFVGRSVVVSPVRVNDGSRIVELRGFVPIRVPITLSEVRARGAELTSIRDQLQLEHPGETLYLPFQFRSDGLRMMSNYFAKVPKQVVELLFDETGIGEAAADPPDDDLTDSEDLAPSPVGFLAPFKPKRDTEYVTTIVGGLQRRSRFHETLVNRFASWLVDRGFVGVGRNAAIDLGIADPPIIIEAKTVPGGKDLSERRLVSFTSTAISGLLTIIRIDLPRGKGST